MITQVPNHATFLCSAPDKSPTVWATGVRHDMANILTVIHLACEILPDVSRAYQEALVESTIMACERGKALLASRQTHS